MNSRTLMVVSVITALIAQPMAAAADPPAYLSTEEIAALPVHGPLSYQSALDCSALRCAQQIQTVDAGDSGGGGAATSTTTWIVVIVIAVLVVAAASGGGGGGGYMYPSNP